MTTTNFNIQGHRGARGLYPENTLAGFLEAVKLGLHTLEMDVVISKDRMVVVSHEAWMNPDFCSLPEGGNVPANDREKYNLFEMPYASIKRFDCGIRPNPHFPLQKPIASCKPLLSEVIREVDFFIKSNNLPAVTYNIEIKTEPGSQKFNPPAEEFTKLVYQEIVDLNVKDRVSIQSFDLGILIAMHALDSKLSIGLLNENKITLANDLNVLGFVPPIYSPEFTLVTEALVSEVQDRGLHIIPWTVNDEKDMKHLISLGVDGIITDYPDRLVAIISMM